VGLGRRIVRKSVRKATPRSVRRAMHPARTVKNAVTPRPVKQLSRTKYVVTNPVGAAENKVIGAALGNGSKRRTARRPATGPRPSTAGGQAVGTGARATEAAALLAQLGQLMGVGHQQFAEAGRPVIPEPSNVDPKPFMEAEWASRKTEARWWQRSRRRQIRAEARDYAARQASDIFARAQSEQRGAQNAADVQWHRLCQGDRSAVTMALTDAFKESPSAVEVMDVGGSGAAIAVTLPGPLVLPEKMPHTTPTGKPSAKVWPKTEFNEAYAQLLGAHLLAAIRRSWAAAPSLSQLRIIGLRTGPDTQREALFDVEVSRADGSWNNDHTGVSVLERAQRGLNRAGRAREVRAWPTNDLPPDILLLLRPTTAS